MQSDRRSIDRRSIESDGLSVVDETSEFNYEPESAPEPDEHDKLAHKETQLVSYSRVMVALVLIGAATLLSLLTHASITSDEREEFEEEFSRGAEDLIVGFHANAQNVEQVSGLFSTLLSSTAHNDQDSWPFYTLPDFESFGRPSREMTGVLLLAVSPLVTEEERPVWEVVSVEQQGWIQEGFAALNQTAPAGSIRGSIHGIDGASEESMPLYSPLWQMSPPPSDPSSVNLNLLHHPTYRRLVDIVSITRKPVVSEVLDLVEVLGTAAPILEDPQSIVMLPIFKQVDSPSSEIVGHVIAVVAWNDYFKDILATEQGDLIVVLRESCGSEYSFTVAGTNATFIGIGDLHDGSYDNLKTMTTFATIDRDALSEVQDIEEECDFIIDVYPTADLESNHSSNSAVVFTIGVVSVFAFTSLVFILYDRVVQRRQNRVLKMASRTTALLSSLFPKNVRDQLFGNEEAKRQKRQAELAAERRSRVLFGRAQARAFSASQEMKSFLPEESEVVDSAPIADLFPSATVLFADIAGFTAWSSSREPSQVFILLETLYRAFDKIAKQRGVFKVETIGDCYVAVVGLPDPCEDHAVVMCRFARDCMEKMNDLVHKLEVTLGPDTGDLAMRIGLHSGPVTAGVLRGDRARFQLFGDTVNTASRMESTGIKNKIQLTQETADLLAGAGKAHWIEPRNEAVEAKGKGRLQTYWFQAKTDATFLASSNSDASVNQDTERREKPRPRGVEAAFPSSSGTNTAKVQRMIDWNCDLLMQLLLRVVSKRHMEHGRRPSRVRSMRNLEYKVGRSATCLDEVAEVIHLPKFDSAAYEFDPRTSDLSETVVGQLHNYVAIVASMYRGNPFHSFEHASHVTMSTVKLLSRIVAPKVGSSDINDEDLHDHTYGITSDPLTQFAVVFAALIHDLDHRGVPNFVLNREDPAMASVYRYKSVAEQNSIDVAWELLMDPGFEDLRKAIYTDETEMKRFRQLIVNTVIATDIFDKELNNTRKSRWDKAFAGQESFSDMSRAINRKATVVIEHLIQASDVSHTMQHWHVYQKWNERLFHEMYAAYVLGRTDKDPTDGWYEGELKFFDNYIIPLAKKLKDCGVFGVSSDEYLNYAEKNRAEWELKGKELVAALQRKYSAKLAKKQLDPPSPQVVALIPTPTRYTETATKA